MTRPELFADLEFDAALQQSNDQHKLLLVDATASWCGPCQVMDRTTWVDPAVVDSLRDRALTIQIDVDGQEELAKRLRIKAMPTVIAFRGGKEIDRVTGLQRRDELLAWVDALEHGKTSLDAKRAESAAKPDDMHARMALARQLVESLRLEEATEEYVWLWQHMLERQPSMIGVRLSYLVRELQELFALHSPARDAFTELRATVAPVASTQPQPDALTDWFALNDALGESEASLAWFDSARATLEPDEKMTRLLEHRIAPMLAAANRWADLGRLYATPLATFAQAVELHQHMTTMRAPDAPPGMVEGLAAYAKKAVRTKATELVRALRAADRSGDADAVRAEALRVDPSAEMATALADAEAARDRD